MFLICGNQWKYEIIPGGLKVHKFCPECERPGEFIEVKPTKYFTAYFIPLIKTDSKRAVLECPHCQSHFYIKADDYLSAKHQPVPDPPPREEKQASPQDKTCINCSFCGKTLRVPVMEKLIKVTCPGCKYKLHVASGEIL